MIIACYARKSNDKENDSIENQFSIINSYISQQKDLQDFEILRFSDNGFSGIDMHRDSFQELLSRIRQREIDIVIVKDLSRLGRNYLEVCKLTDSIFPFMGVRLISVSEQYDSKYQQRNTMDLPTAFKAVMNEYYVMESSEKLKKSCKFRIRNGEFIGSISYGYFLSDKYTPQIDAEKAAVVRTIFRCYLEGNSTLQIAKMLNEQKIPSPCGKKWTYGRVYTVLRNESYTGKKVSLMKTKDVKTHQKTFLPESEWYINDTAFPVIIDKEMYEHVQRKLRRHSGYYSADKHMMARKLYCAGCNRTLQRGKNFYCKNRYTTGEKPCFDGILKRDILYKAVLEKVKKYIQSEISDVTSGFSFSDIAKIEAEITELKEEKAAIFDKLYAESVTEQEFAAQNQAVSQQIAACQDKLECCRKSVALYTRYTAERLIETLRRLYVADELTKEHMQFVKRINVFDAEHFEILLQDSSPLDVLCRNMSIYEEELT